MSDDLVKIEVNGIELQAHKGQMLIEVTDAAGITIPRFCYHKKLSVAANCRMCLVEVAKAPKPLPACATPVMDGMKVLTHSPKALAAQKGTMEFLLINHPLDCPICDQGGECELQDIAVGYGGDVSHFSERKRAVKDKNIGPLVATEMTRCIHCTRCVRFGEEIAGLREMGATGRGEHTEIGTFVEMSLASELSGNIIDLCPVGALTAKPSRYTARSWEMVQRPSVAGHDSVGSNIYYHVRGGKVFRVVPRENEQINEVWLSDRDRFSYEGLNSSDRALTPMRREAGELKAVAWEDALLHAAERLKSVIEKHGAEQVGFVVSPNVTLEEGFLIKRLAANLGVGNVDYRLRQLSFSGQKTISVGNQTQVLSLSDLDQTQAVFVIGSNLRLEQPLLAHRVRKAAMRGANVAFLNPYLFQQNFLPSQEITLAPHELLASLARIAVQLSNIKGKNPPSIDGDLGVTAASEVAIATALAEAEHSVVIMGQIAYTHPDYEKLMALTQFIGLIAGARVAFLTEGANSAGLAQVGLTPQNVDNCSPGKNAREMWENQLQAYVLIGFEPEFDTGLPFEAAKALRAAKLVIALTPFQAGLIEHEADVLLPIATLAETSGTLINFESREQSFSAAVLPVGEARPGWKVLRVLGNMLGLDGFDYSSSEDVLSAFKAEIKSEHPQKLNDEIFIHIEKKRPEGLQRVAVVPPYSVDGVVRRAQSLQQTQLRGQTILIINGQTAHSVGLIDGGVATVTQGGGNAVLSVVVDHRLPDNCVLIPAALSETATLDLRCPTVEASPSQ